MTRILITTNNKEVLLSDEDYEKYSQKKWVAQERKYTWYVVRSGNPWISLHRLITDCPIDMEVDHINGNGLDNRRENLRIVTKSQNGHNRRRVKGYHRVGYRKKWKATIMVNHRSIFLGYFDKEEDAAKAYADAKREHFPELF